MSELGYICFVREYLKFVQPFSELLQKVRCTSCSFTWTDWVYQKYVIFLDMSGAYWVRVLYKTAITEDIQVN